MTPAYLLRYLPTLSETFVYDELAELERGGSPPAIWAMDPGPTGPVHAGLEPLMERCTYIPRAHRPSVLRLGPASSAGPLRQTWDRWGARPKDLRRALWLADDLHRRGVGALHVHFAAEMAEVAWVASQRRGIAYSVTVHARDLYCPRPSLADVLGGARLVVTISEANRRHLLGLGVAGLDARLRVVRQGIPLPANPAELGGGEGPLRITSVGRLVVKKGHDLLLRALAAAIERGLDARLTLVGEGPQRPRLEALTAELELGDRVELRGGRPREEVDELLDRGTDLFALACRVAEDGDRDGIPVALMEAMSRGLPVLSTPVSGIPELVEDGTSGVIAAAASPAALSAALVRLGVDAGLRGRLGRGARRRVEREHDVVRQVARLAELFRRFHGAASAG